MSAEVILTTWRRFLGGCGAMTTLVMLQGCPGTDGGHPPVDPYKHDIAVLKLDVSSGSLNPATRALLQAIPPVAIATAADSWSNNNTVGIVGFGQTRAAQLDSAIKRTGIVLAKQCSNSANAGMICFGVEASGHAVCGGDSGGPMLKPVGNKLVVIGVASRTEYSCGSGEGIYADITKPEYRNWIQSKLSAWTPPAGVQLIDVTPDTAAHGTVTVGGTNPSTTVTVSNAQRIIGTLNFPKEKLDPVQTILQTRDFVLSLNSSTTSATCLNDNGIIEMVRHCQHAPITQTDWTAAVSPRSGDSGQYQMTISILENISPSGGP